MTKAWQSSHMYLVEWGVSRVRGCMGGGGGAASQPPTQSLGQYRVAVMVVAVVGVVASQCVSRAKQMNAFRASKTIVAAEYCTSRPLMLSERTAVSIHVRSILIH